MQCLPLQIKVIDMAAAPISLKEYFASPGSVFTKADAEIIGPQVEALSEEAEITERVLVDTARSTNSPLHQYFEWDNVEAGDRYRLIQAGQMMRAIKVRMVVDERPRVMPVYKLVNKAEAPKPQAKGYNALNEDSAFAAKMAAGAYDDLMTWRARYSGYLAAWASFASKFRQVANQIAEFQDVADTGELDRETDEALQALLAWRDRFGSVVENWGALAEQGRFMLEVINEAEQAFVPKNRSCVRCHAVFHSVGAGNRLCQTCGRTASRMAASSNTIGV